MTGEPLSMAGYRTPQLFSGDRVLVLSTFCACLLFAALAFVTFAKWVVVIPVIVWFVLLRVYQQMSRVDPLMRSVVWRHIRLNRYYPARSGIAARPLSLPGMWR